MASKYDVLAEYLRRQPGPALKLTFNEVERIVGQLPAAAMTYRAWWSNNAGHTHARNGWLAAGWKTSRVSMDNRTLDFVRAPTPVPHPGAQVLAPSTARYRDIHFDTSTATPTDQPGNPIMGDENFIKILRAIQRYVDGEIVETELGRIIRKHWGKPDTES